MTDNEHIDKIEKQWSIGKAKYILLHGVFGWGVIVAVFVVLIDLFIFKKRIDTTDTIFKFIIYPGLGIVFGAVMWELSGRKLSELTNKKELWMFIFAQ